MTFKEYRSYYPGGSVLYCEIGQLFFDLNIIDTDLYAYTDRPHGEERAIMETVSEWTSGRFWRDNDY